MLIWYGFDFVLDWNSFNIIKKEVWRNLLIYILRYSRFFVSIIFGFKWFLYGLSGLSGYWYNNKYFISINEIFFFLMYFFRCRYGYGYYVNVFIINCNWIGLKLFIFILLSV